MRTLRSAVDYLLASILSLVALGCLIVAACAGRVIKRRAAGPAPRRLLIVGYTPISEAQEKGIIGDDLNIWFNPGEYFEHVTVAIVAGRRAVETELSQRISYKEWGPNALVAKLGLRFTARILGFIPATAAVMSLARRADVMQVNGPNAAAVSGLFARLATRIPSAVFIEAFWEDILSVQPLPLVIRRLLPFWYRVVYRAFDAYSGGPTMYPERYIALGMRPEKIRPFLNNVVADEVLERAETASAPKILEAAPHPRFITVGRLHEEKKSQHALDAFLEYANGGGVGSLIFVGAGPLLADLEQAAKSAGLRERVIFTGALPTAQAGAAVLSSDFFLATYQGNALVEALALGCPVIAYDNAPHRALAKDCPAVSFVPDLNVTQLAKAMAGKVENMQVGRDATAAEARTWARKRYSREKLDATAVDPLIWAFQSFCKSN